MIVTDDKDLRRDGDDSNWAILRDAVGKFEGTKPLDMPVLCLEDGYVDFWHHYPSLCSGRPSELDSASQLRIMADHGGVDDYGANADSIENGVHGERSALNVALFPAPITAADLRGLAGPSKPEAPSLPSAPKPASSACPGKAAATPLTAVSTPRRNQILSPVATGSGRDPGELSALSRSVGALQLPEPITPISDPLGAPPVQPVSTTTEHEAQHHELIPTVSQTVVPAQKPVLSKARVDPSLLPEQPSVHGPDDARAVPIAPGVKPAATRPIVTTNEQDPSEVIGSSPNEPCVSFSAAHMQEKPNPVYKPQPLIHKEPIPAELVRTPRGAQSAPIVPEPTAGATMPALSANRCVPLEVPGTLMSESAGPFPGAVHVQGRPNLDSLHMTQPHHQPPTAQSVMVAPVRPSMPKPASGGTSPAAPTRLPSTSGLRERSSEVSGSPSLPTQPPTKAVPVTRDTIPAIPTSAKPARGSVIATPPDTSQETALSRKSVGRAGSMLFPPSVRSESTKPTVAKAATQPKLSPALSNDRKPSFDRRAKPSGKPGEISVRMTPEFRRYRLSTMDAVAGSGGRVVTGLRNLGNTCFMNSVLQCLSCTVPLAKYFVQGRYRSDINRRNKLGSGGEIVEEFGELVSTLWTRGFRHVSPKLFKASLAKFAPRFAGTQQQDCQEFAAFLLDGIHEDLNRAASQAYVEETELAGIPAAEAAAIAWKRHKRRNDSIVVDLMQGQFRSTVRCKSCDHSSVSFEPFMFLTLTVPANCGRASIDALISNFSRDELVQGADQWYCSKCKTHRDAVKRIEIWKLPMVLIIHLKRFFFEGPFRSKINSKVDFPLSGFDPRRFVAGGGRASLYSLYGIANHIGDLSGGHYTAYCKNPFSGRWNEYNDSTVTPVPEHRLTSNQSYLLFYTAIDFDQDLF